MQIKKNNRFIPLYVSLGVIAGILIGTLFSSQYNHKSISIIEGSGNKLFDMLYTINDHYVDTVDVDELVEKALPDILKGLDPHSVYLNKDEVDKSMAELNGSFSGIGVQFMRFRDSVLVTSVIKGGPSENVGLQAGDRIISANKKNLTGKDITNEIIMKTLKGEEGSVVNLEIVRPGEDKVLKYSIVRGSVPVRTISSAYMLSETTGYISISSFGESTYAEFLAALAKLCQNDFQSLVIDLRGNLGGYMSAAVSIANEFLPKGQCIVYTEGRKSPRENYSSDGRGGFQNLPLVILIDETSASASEILAGAIQDNDRGIVIGRRSFGKGLVQIPIEFNDGSMLRLTKARYFTPSGRCVQKPYVIGDEQQYENDLLQRLEHGEYYSSDSIKTDGEKFYTRLGRTVYGGGGIIPDIFVPMDTTHITSYYKDAYVGGYMNKFSVEFVDKHRKDLAKIDDLKDIKKYLNRMGVVEKFATFAEKEGLKRRNLMIQKSYQMLSYTLYQLIVNDAYSRDVAIEYLNESDPYIEHSLKVIKEGKTFPELKTEDKCEF